MAGDDLSYSSAGSIAEAIKAKKLSPVEVVDHFIRRIETRNPSLNAVVHLAPEEARKAAKAAEQAVMAGEKLGPLHGVPVAIKNLFDFKPGWPTTLGGKRYADTDVLAVSAAFERLRPWLETYDICRKRKLS